jgi:small subunit ribosomal protein S18
MPRRTIYGRDRRSRPNPLDTAAITCIGYEDTAVPGTFISDRQEIGSRRVTRLRPCQQREVPRALKDGREIALLPGTSGSGQ